MANHLPFQLTGSPVVSFGSTFLRDQAFGDLATDLLPLETVLNDVARDVVSAWR